jgi:hypothetical protein|tara:strand:- start:59 stop:469 length:411 start_codon:yes stop_codon:yes gene_type:complete
MNDNIKIAIIGNKDWQNRRKVQEILQRLKTENTNVTVIGAGGSEGANHMVRKYALEFGMNYKEYNPSYSGYNLYSAMPKTYYGKSYHFSQLHHRMKLIAENCDYMMIITNEKTLDPFLKTAYNNINKRNKPVVLLG